MPDVPNTLSEGGKVQDSLSGTEIAGAWVNRESCGGEGGGRTPERGAILT